MPLLNVVLHWPGSEISTAGETFLEALAGVRNRKIHKNVTKTS